MKRFLLFVHYRDAAGGFHDFDSAHETYESAKQRLAERTQGWFPGLEAHVARIGDGGDLELFASWDERHRHGPFDGWAEVET